MKKVKLIILLFTTVLLFTSCKKNKIELQVEFKLRLLDTLGNEKTVFNQGENIIFSFLVKNNTYEDLMLENFFPNDNFFRVYQPNTDERTLDYGIPYDGICEIGYFPIHANDILKINCPLVNSENNNFYYSCLITDTTLHKTFLSIGNYHTEFTQSFKIGDIQTEEKQFRINFTVK